ncbi:T9SS type A sorting domain-containing protein [uncultured Algibacter sp.]|uniref:right-handed parallel beta-helix repeat-containing protein n=1 Tax=uncultured Algibacter sp. TaxID=298659 RepID=UPI00262A5603|nr:T9SS type A sorting domain-containing protein [uncultured Algibacter sp.]
MDKLNQLCLFTFLLLFPGINGAQNIYVATDGDDNNDGSINNPYKTFSKAVSVITPGDICIIKGGTYEEELFIAKNGNSGNYLTFKAADGETVNIKATSIINGWQPHNGSIYKVNVDMTIESRFRAVYHDSEYMDLARWPNNTDNNRWTVNCTPVTGGDGSHFLANGIPNIDWTGGLVYYLGAHSGTSWTRTITSSSTNKINYTAVDINKWPFKPHNPTQWRNNPGNNRGQLYLFNKLEALDYAREWYYDNTSKTLYFQTPDGNIPEDNSVEFATRKYAAQLSGDYIKLERLNFYGGALKVNNRADNNIIENCMVVHGSEGHDSLTNTSAQVAEAALEVLGDNTIVRECTVNHSSVSGIVIAGWAAATCTIEGNYISNIDYVGIHASPIRTSANHTKILKNTIFNAGRDGMYVAGADCEIAYNDVSASQLINSDSGIFYTVGNNNLKNGEIHHNWFHDATAPAYSHTPGSPGKAAGIYLDNNSKGYLVHHNVIWNVSWSGYQVNWNNTNLDFFHNTIWNAERAMDSWVNGYPQANNKIYNSFSSTLDWFAGNGPQEFDIQDNLISPTSPFEDPDNINFMPKAGSAVVDQAQIISGFQKPYKGSAPDIGAYELGGTAWTAGVNAIEDTGDALSIDEDVLHKIKLFPNPTNNILNFRLPNNLISNNLSISIYSSLGYLIKVIQLDKNVSNGHVMISLADLSSGLYILRISDSGETKFTSKFIKN